MYSIRIIFCKKNLQKRHGNALANFATRELSFFVLLLITNYKARPETFLVGLKL
jgi:hypothetical protein